MSRKLQELEEQLKIQSDEILSKVGPEAGDSQGGLLSQIEWSVLNGQIYHDLVMTLVPLS